MKFLRITSTANPHIREIAGITRRRSTGGKDSFLIEGTHLIEMALSSGAVIQEIFCTRAFAEKTPAQDILRRCSQSSCRMFEVTDQVLGKLTDTETPQGIAAVVSRAHVSLDALRSGDRSLFVAVDGIQDPGNLGTIIRTSDAAGADAVILLPGTCDALLPKTIRATSGSIFTIPVVPSDLPVFLKWLRARGVCLAVTAVHTGTSVFETRLRRPAVLVFGSESRGVSSSLTQAADLLITIPIFGKAESLNVAASAAVCIYEAVRQGREHGD